MSVLTSEAVVLRTWPVHESDLIVSFFTRDYGRMKGVAKAALKSRKRFGGALEPMTMARAWFAERPRQELVRLDQLEIVRSPLAAPVDAVRLTALSFYAELLDEVLPEHDPQETVFRLLVSVLEQTTVAQSDIVQPQSAGKGLALNVHDSQALEGLIEEGDKVAYADSAYQGGAIDAVLTARNVRARINEKSTRWHPLKRGTKSGQP